MASTFNPPTPSRRTLPPSSANSPYRTFAFSTPHQLARSSVEAGGSSSATHESVDRFVLSELNGHILADVEDFFERWIAPSGQEESVLFAGLVDAVLNAAGMSRDDWNMPGTFSDRGYLPWIGRRMKEVCDRSLQQLAENTDDELKGQMDNLRVGDSTEAPISKPRAKTTEEQRLVRMWMERLGNRAWATKPGNMTGATGTRAVDVVLTATPDASDRWDTALVVGEHKSTATLRERKAATAQLAGYAGEMFGVQPFRHVIPGFTLFQDKMQLWMCDRMGCFGSTMFSISTNEPESRRRFVELALAFALMDYTEIGFDPDVYSDEACRNMWTPPTLQAPNDEIRAYVKVQEEIFRLHKTLFIRPGLVCRGTRCFLATSASDDDGTEYIVKMSWRFEGLSAEGTLLEQVGRNPQVRNVVRLHAHKKGRNVQTSIRKGPLVGNPFVLKEPGSSRKVLADEISEVDHEAHNRILTTTVLKDTGRPLTEAATPLELLRAVRASFIGHGTLYFQERILHRDISRSNILLGPSPSKPGFLIDLDYAVNVDSISLQPGLSGAPHRTGTLPYMAIDILNHVRNAHLFHHDVESFLYVLIWCCAYGADDRGFVPSQSDPDRHRRVEAAEEFFGVTREDITEEHLCDPLAKWRKGTYQDIGPIKREGIENRFDALLGLLRPGWDVSPVLDLLRTMRRELFGSDDGPILLPSRRAKMKGGWRTEDRRADELALFENIQAGMDVAIAELETLGSG